MAAVPDSYASPTVPLIRKLLMPVFIVLCLMLSLALNGWAIHKVATGLTTGRWMLDVASFQIVIIGYVISGLVCSGCCFAWYIRMLRLRVQKRSVWADRPLVMLFAASAITFLIMTGLHVSSEIILCQNGSLEDCGFGGR